MQAAGYEGPSVFSQNAVRLIARLSNGLPRRINVVADKALLSCSLDLRYEVRSRDIASAAREIKLERTITGGDTWLIRIGSFFMGATAGILCLMFALNQGWVSVKGRQAATVEAEASQPTTPSTTRSGELKTSPQIQTSGDANGPSLSNLPVPAVDAQNILSGVLDGDDYNFKKDAPGKAAPGAPTPTDSGAKR
jgi:MSHA biogenesis protein MshM